MNVSGKDEQMSAQFIGFPQKRKAKVITLWHEDETVINEIGVCAGKKHHIEPVESETDVKDGVLHATLRNNSVNIFVIE